MAKMTSGDWKGDTARGARHAAEANARRWDREERKRDKQRSKNPPRDFDQELEDYLYKPIDVQALIDKIPFDEEDVESAAAENPTLYLDAARLRVQKMRKRTQAKMRYEAVAARTRLRTGGTIQEKNDRSLLKSEVRQAQREMEAALRVEEFAKALLSVFKERKDAYRAIIDARWGEAANVVKNEKKREAHNVMKRLQSEVKARYRQTREDEDED